MHSESDLFLQRYRLAAIGISDVFENEKRGLFRVEVALMAGFSSPDIISLTLCFNENALRYVREFFRPVKKIKFDIQFCSLIG